MENQASAGGALGVDRSRLYKNKFKDGEELRRRRNDASIELRKVSKTDQLMKRRNVATLDSDSDTASVSTSPLKEVNYKDLDAKQFDNICKGIFSKDVGVKFQNVSLCRRALSREKSPPIDEFTERKVVPELVACLQASGTQEAANLVFEAAWALTNIASGKSRHTRAVVEAGAVPHFIRLLNCGQDNVAEQSVWALGNIAGDGAELRDLVIKAGAVAPLLQLIRASHANDSLLSNATWFLSNLCRNKNPSPSAAAVKLMLPVLADLLMVTSKQVVQDATWALSYLSDAADELVAELLSYAVVIPRLVDLLSHAEPTVITPALRTLGNIVTGTDSQTQSVLDAGLLGRCHALLSHVKPNIVKEACWTLSNVTAGSQTQIQALIEANLVPRLLSVMSKGDYKSQKEATWAASNLVSGGSEAQIGYLVNNGAVPAFCGMLGVNDAKLLIIVLESVQRILTVAAQYGQEEQLCLAVEQCDGLDKLEALQEHDNEMVYELAYKIVDKFFSAEDGAEAEALPDGEQFGFAAPDSASSGAEPKQTFSF